MQKIQKNKRYDKITPQQQIYIEELLKGKSQRQAYMIAYPKAKNWDVDSVDTAASSLFNNPKVMKRFAECQKMVISEVAKRVSWDREDAIKSLRNLLEVAEKEIEEFGKLNMTRVTAIKEAIKELNSMHGYTNNNIVFDTKVLIVGKEDDLPD